MLCENQRAFVLISRCLPEKYKAYDTAEEAKQRVNCRRHNTALHKWNFLAV